MVIIQNPTLSHTTLSSANDVILTAMITDEDNLQVKYDIYVNGVCRNSSMVFVDSPIEIEYAINFSILKSGDNEVILQATNSNGDSSSWTGIITVQEHDAEIIIHNPSILVPKNTPVDFPFEIKAPFYLNKEVTKDIEVIDNGNLGNGKMFTIDIAPLKPMFKNIKDVVLELRW